MSQPKSSMVNGESDVGQSRADHGAECEGVAGPIAVRSATVRSPRWPSDGRGVVPYTPLRAIGRRTGPATKVVTVVARR